MRTWHLGLCFTLGVAVVAYLALGGGGLAEDRSVDPPSATPEAGPKLRDRSGPRLVSDSRDGIVVLTSQGVAGSQSVAESGSIVDSYLALLRASPPDHELLRQFLSELSIECSGDEDLAKILIQIVGLHGGNTEDQRTCVFAVNLIRARADENPVLYLRLHDWLFDQVGQDPAVRNERVIQALAQLAKLGYGLGHLPDPVTPEFYDAYMNSNDPLLRAQLLTTMPGTGNDELTLEAIENELYRKANVGLSGVALAVQIYARMAKHSAPQDQSKIARTVVDFASSRSLSLVEWGMLWALLAERLEFPDRAAHAVELIEHPAESPELRELIQRRKAQFEIGGL